MRPRTSRAAGTRYRQYRHGVVLQGWIYTAPGVAIMFTVLGVNLIGDWLRDYLDPRLNV